MIDWTYNNEKTGQRLATSQSEDSLEAYEAAAKIAQRLANKNQVGVAFTAWLEDREGATAYRYPRKQGRPATGKAMTGAERIAKLRNERKQKGVCPCCGQNLPKSDCA